MLDATIGQHRQRQQRRAVVETTRRRDVHLLVADRRRTLQRTVALELAALATATYATTQGGCRESRAAKHQGHPRIVAGKLLHRCFLKASVGIKQPAHQLLSIIAITLVAQASATDQQRLRRQQCRTEQARSDNAAMGGGPQLRAEATRAVVETTMRAEVMIDRLK
jgi:hypothetical protein